MRMYQYNNDGFLMDAAGYTPQINPVNPLYPLIRPRSTELIPPIQQDNQVIQYANSAWSAIPDYRGFSYYLPNGTSETIKAVNITPPLGYLTAAPAPTTAQLSAIERVWAQSELRISDPTLLPDSPYTEADQTLIKQYRALLRNPAREAHADYPAMTWRPVWPEGIKVPE